MKWGAFTSIKSSQDVDVPRILIYPENPSWIPSTPAVPSSRRFFCNSTSPESPSLSGSPSSDSAKDFLKDIQCQWGDEIYQVLGYSAEKAGTTLAWWIDLIHPSDRSVVCQTLAAHLQYKPSINALAGLSFCSYSRLWYHEYRLKTRSGGWLAVGDRMSTTRNAEGVPIQSESFIFIKDVRENCPSRKADLSDVNNFKIVSKTMSSALIMMNQAGYVTFMNSAAEKLLGFNMSDLQKMTLHEACHSLRPDGTTYHIDDCPMHRLLRSNAKDAIISLPETFINADGIFFPIIYSLSPLSGGFANGAVLEFRDVTEEKRMHDEWRKAVEQGIAEKEGRKREEGIRRQMGEFIDYICHEVRNPLHGISANRAFLSEALNQLETSLAQDPVQELDVQALGISSTTPVAVVKARQSPRHILSWARESLQAIEECAQHQSGIINHVLDLSMLESGKLILNDVIFSPWEIASQAIHMVQAKAAERMIKIVLETGSQGTGGLVLKGDDTTLRQIYLNLLGNANKFANSKSKMIVRLDHMIDEATKLVTITGSVSDEGIGMTEVEVGNLFQRFSQANRQVSNQYGGSGLGLSIAKELVHLVHGELTVKSEIGKGSTFIFTAKYPLPTDAEKAEFLARKVQQPLLQVSGVSCPAPPYQSEAPKAPKFQNIMAVEDNKLNRTILEKYLSKRSSITLKEDGQVAYEYFISPAGRALELIIMDCEMPRLDGRQATKMIREWEAKQPLVDGVRKRIPIVALSGNARQSQIEEAKTYGMDDYLSKPCSRSTLDEMIAKWERIAFTGA